MFPIMSIKNNTYVSQISKIYILTFHEKSAYINLDIHNNVIYQIFNYFFRLILPYVNVL